MSIFNEYLTGEEREVALENARLQNEYDKLSTVYEMLNLQVEQMRRDAEMKVFEESGTYDDLTFLYQEAENEIGEQKKNVFQKIVDWFKKIFAAIGNKIKSIFGSKVEEIEVPADYRNFKMAFCSNGMETSIDGADGAIQKIKLPARSTVVVSDLK